MARSKAQPAGDEKDTPTPPGGSMTVTLKGTPDEVREHLGTAPTEDAAAPPGPVLPANGAPSPQKAAYLEALKDPRNTVIVKRISPRKWGDEDLKVNVEVYREQCPLDAVGIEEEIRGEHGGRKYRSAVINSETGQIIAADTFDVDTDPLIKSDEPSPELERMFMEQGQQPSGDVSEQMLERQTRLTAKQIEYETTRQQLEALKGQQASGKPDPRVEARIRELEVQSIHQQADRKVEAAEARHRAELDEVKRQLSHQAQPKPPTTEDPLIKMMMEQNKQANERFEKLLTQMNDNRMADIQRQIAELKNKPQAEGSSLKEAVITVKELMGIMGHGDDEDEDEDDDGEGKPFLERLADKYLPKVFDMIDEEQKKTGKELSKEEVVARINGAADQAVREEMQRRAAVAAATAAAQRALPAPAPSPAGPAPAPVQPAPAPAAPPERKVPSIEEEIKVRVASVMAVLERELIIRPRGWQWTLAAWQALPEELRERLCAQNIAAVEAISVFDGQVNQMGLDLIKKKLAEDPKAAAWFNHGLLELRGWALELEKDPDFDPTDETEEPEEE